MSKTPPMNTTTPPTIHAWRPTSTAPTLVIAKPINVRAFGVSPIRPIARAIGSKIALIRDLDSLEMVIAGLAS
jgi:hypothetical protein